MNKFDIIYGTVISVAAVVLTLVLTIVFSAEYGAKKYRNCLAATNGNAEWCMKSI